MKQLNQIGLLKRLFASIKGYLCLTEGHLDSPEGPEEVEFSLIRSYF